MSLTLVIKLISTTGLNDTRRDVVALDVFFGLATFCFIVEEVLFIIVTAGKMFVPIDDRLDLDGLMLLNCFGSDVNASMFASPPIVSCVTPDRPNRRIDLERNTVLIVIECRKSQHFYCCFMTTEKQAASSIEWKLNEAYPAYPRFVLGLSPSLLIARAFTSRGIDDHSN